MTERFNIFEHTSLYRDYQFVFENKIITEENIDFYTHSKSELAVIFNCPFIPSDDQILSYIRREEVEIDYENIKLFNTFVRVIYELLNQSLFNYNKQKKITDKDAVKRAKQDAKAEERARIKEITRLEKLELKIKEANKVCICDCGKSYTASNKLKHLSTALHHERLESIRYFCEKNKIEINI
jgi:hypothetical protein